MPAETLPDTVTDFLAWARRNGGGVEFLGGTVQPQPAATLLHDTICGNLFAALHAGADGIDRHVFQRALVEVPGAGFFCPDIVFGTWNPAGDEVHVRGPQLIVEVMSPATAARDRGVKWKAYQQMAALERYVLVDEAEWSVEVFARGADLGWRYDRLTGTGDALTIPSIGFSMPLAAIYRGVFRA